MLYLGIDQHAKQLTIDLGNEMGDLVLHRQVKTHWKALRQFLDELTELAQREGGILACVEVCGFNDYLLELLEEYGIQTILVQPEGRKKNKTDRRDARALREELWVNRKRLEEGKRPAKLRVVRRPSEADAADRQLTTLQTRLTRHRTRILNKIQTIVRKRNLQHECPTKGFQTKKARQWLESLSLPEIDRMEMDILLQQWIQVDQHLDQVRKKVQQSRDRNETAALLASIPGMGAFNSLSVACRLGDIEDFPRGSSLANFFGLAPGSRNSGEAYTCLRITKAGSSHVRYVLGQVTLHVLRQDAWMRQWYQKIKRRRGSKIARVAVMRRLATIIWAMVKHGMPYVKGGPEKFREALANHRQLLATTGGAP
jgi:transposase